MKTRTASRVVAIAAAVCAAGCFSVKTESEIKPIHITMDVNLKVDKALEKAFADESKPQPQGSYKEVKAMMDRKAAGLTSLGLLEAREGATDDDKMLIAEENIKRRKRFEDIAKESGVSMEAVQRRHAAKIRERIPAGSGVWYQNDAGEWLKK